MQVDGKFIRADQVGFLFKTDVGDFGKYGLLRSLSGMTAGDGGERLRLGVICYFTTPVRPCCFPGIRTAAKPAGWHEAIGTEATPGMPRLRAHPAPGGRKVSAFIAIEVSAAHRMATAYDFQSVREYIDRL